MGEKRPLIAGAKNSSSDHRTDIGNSYAFAEKRLYSHKRGELIAFTFTA